MSDRHDHPANPTEFHIEDSVWDSYTEQAREEGAMLSASQVRRLGDRRRLHRRVAITAAALAVAVGAAGGIALPMLRSPNQAAGPQTSLPVNTPSVSPSQVPTTPAESTPPSTPVQSTAPQSSAPVTSAPPSSTPPSSTPPSSTPPPPAESTPPAGPLPDSALPNSQQIYLREPGDMGPPYYMDGLGTGSDEPTLWICENGIAQTPGIVNSRTAIFSYDSVIRRAYLMEMGSEQEATKVATTIRGWNANCTQRLGTQGGKPVAHDEATTTVDGAQVDFSVQQLSRSDGNGVFNGVLVIVKGNRVLIVLDTVIGQDYNAVGPAQHAKNPDLPLVSTAIHLDEIIAQMSNR